MFIQLHMQNGFTFELFKWNMPVDLKNIVRFITKLKFFKFNRCSSLYFWNGTTCGKKSIIINFEIILNEIIRF